MTQAKRRTVWGWESRGAYQTTRGRCRGPNCRQWVHWILMVKTGRNMPFDQLTVLDRQVIAGGVQVLLDLADNHHATCVDRARFASKSRPAVTPNYRTKEIT